MNHRPILIVMIATTLTLAACGSDDDTNAATTAPAPAATSADSASTTEGSSEGDVGLASNAELGDYLVDTDGRTLYLFERDDGTTTACTGACADNWPPIVAVGEPVAGAGIDATELGTADGIEPNQITYHGHLLYYFAGDQAPGDTNGLGIPDWYAVDASGEAIAAG